MSELIASMFSSHSTASSGYSFPAFKLYENCQEKEGERVLTSSSVDLCQNEEDILHYQHEKYHQTGCDIVQIIENYKAGKQTCI